MTTPLQLHLKVQLGPEEQIIFYRPPAHNDPAGASWTAIDGDASVVVNANGSQHLELCLEARDPLDEPISNPAWRIEVRARPAGGGWVALDDQACDAEHYVTEALPLSVAATTYQLVIFYLGGSLTQELTVWQSATGDGKPDDIIYDPGDLDPHPHGDQPSAVPSNCPQFPTNA